MAGTLIFGIEALHIYQRRFTTQALLAALKGCHLYFISRRPAARILSSSILSKPYAAKVTVRTRISIDGPDRDHRMLITPPTGEPMSEFQTYMDGSYFSFRSGSQLVHGDAWALASLILKASEEIASQEIMYIGQAFGKDGKRDVAARLSSHETLPKIYEDYLSDGWDVFVTPMRLTYTAFESDDHIDDADDGPNLFADSTGEGYYGTFVDSDDHQTALKPAIDITEHALISHFTPPYNRKLLEWRASAPTEDMRRMKQAGFRLLSVHLDGWGGLARFYSASQPSRVRSHYVSHDIPPSPNKSSSRGVTAQALSSWRPEAHMVKFGHADFASRAETAGVVLRIFGDEAPAIRRPPEVSFDLTA